MIAFTTRLGKLVKILALTLAQWVDVKAEVMHTLAGCKPCFFIHTRLSAMAV